MSLSLRPERERISEGARHHRRATERLVRGRRGITADTALRLARYLGSSAEMWMNLQKLYELRLAEQIVGEEIKHTIVPRQPCPPEPTEPLMQS